MISAYVWRNGSPCFGVWMTPLLMAAMAVSSIDELVYPLMTPTKSRGKLHPAMIRSMKKWGMSRHVVSTRFCFKFWPGYDRVLEWSASRCHTVMHTFCTRPVHATIVVCAHDGKPERTPCMMRLKLSDRPNTNAAYRTVVCHCTVLAMH